MFSIQNENIAPIIDVIDAFSEELKAMKNINYRKPVGSCGI